LGDDTTTYGEAAYVDADIVVLMHERINMGRYVAYFKFMQDPTVLNLLAQPEQLRAALTVKKREDEVIAAAVRSAEQRGLDMHVIAKMFRWMIDETLDLEVEYLRLLKG
jgi:chorismate mutase